MAFAVFAWDGSLDKPLGISFKAPPLYTITVLPFLHPLTLYRQFVNTGGTRYHRALKHRVALTPLLYSAIKSLMQGFVYFT